MPTSRPMATVTLLAIVTTSAAAQRLVPSRPLDIPTKKLEWAQVIFRDSATLTPDVARYAYAGIIVRVLATRADSLTVEVFESRPIAMEPVDTVVVAVPTISTVTIHEYHSLVARRDTALESAFYASLVGGLVGAVCKIFDRNAGIGRSAAIGAGIGAAYGAVLPYRAYGYREYPVTFSYVP